MSKNKYDPEDPRADPSLVVLPASIRSNNPGAMWPGTTSTKFGSTVHENLKDGNKIAYFDSPVTGAAAQFDLLASPRYLGKPIGQVIDEWSGNTGGQGNVSKYADQVAGSVGLKPQDPITMDLLRSVAGVTLAKTQARWEAGKEYPLNDEQWQAAQTFALGSNTDYLASAEAKKRSLGLMN